MSSPARPVIIVSAGRSGSTFLHELLTRNPNVAWISGLANRTGTATWPTNLVLRLADAPRPIPSLVRRRFPGSEHYGFWERLAPGFSEPCRDLTADDVTNRTRQRIQRALLGVRSPSRTHLVLKVTGWPRIGYLSAVLPEAVFVNIVRDARAVVNSLLESPWWDGRKGPTMWRYGPLDHASMEEWDASGRSFAALAALQWRTQVQAALESSNDLDRASFLTVRYEDLCAAPAAELRSICRVADVEWNTELLDQSVSNSVRASSLAWAGDLTTKQISDVETITDPLMHRLGYRGP